MNTNTFNYNNKVWDIQSKNEHFAQALDLHNMQSWADIPVSGIKKYKDNFYFINEV